MHRLSPLGVTQEWEADYLLVAHETSHEIRGWAHREDNGKDPYTLDNPATAQARQCLDSYEAKNGQRP
jgi:hypothetical protein